MHLAARANALGQPDALGAGACFSAVVGGFVEGEYGHGHALFISAYLLRKFNDSFYELPCRLDKRQNIIF